MEKPAIAELKRRIVHLVRTVEDNFAIGIRYRVLARKFYKTAQKHGVDLVLLLEELREEGQIHTYMNAEGSILIMAPEIKQQLEEDDFGFLTDASKALLDSKWGHNYGKEN